MFVTSLKREGERDIYIERVRVRKRERESGTWTGWRRSFQFENNFKLGKYLQELKLRG